MNLKVMQEIKYRALKKQFPKKAKEIFKTQEALAIFLNSPFREKWINKLKLKRSEAKKVKEIIEYYGKLKISEENKKKPKKWKDILIIEDNCLKKIFEGRLFELKHAKSKYFAKRIMKKILEKEFPESVIFTPRKVKKLLRLTEVEKAKKAPMEFIVFDSKKKKIIGIEIVLE